MDVTALFRSSRPDYIETPAAVVLAPAAGGLFRSSRPDYIETVRSARAMATCVPVLFRSSRPDYIETLAARAVIICAAILFRSSRPDYIETVWVPRERGPESLRIVPVFQTGLH